MSNETKTVTPLIAPGAEPRICQMFRESIESHSKDIERAEAIQERLDEGEDHGLDWPDCELVMQALNMLIHDKEESIRKLEEGIEELEKAS